MITKQVFIENTLDGWPAGVFKSGDGFAIDTFQGELPVVEGDVVVSATGEHPVVVSGAAHRSLVELKRLHVQGGCEVERDIACWELIEKYFDSLK